MFRAAAGLACITVSLQAQSADFAINTIVDTFFFESQDSETEWITRGLIEASFSGQKEALSYRISGQMLEGQNASNDIGDIQIASNIDAEEFAKLYEYWLNYQLASLEGEVTLGQIDLNNKFAYAASASEFLNSSMGISPTIFTIPTYPEPAMSLIYEQQMTSELSLAGAVSTGAGDTDFSDVFYMLEWSYQLPDALFKAGAWHHTGKIITLNGNANDGSEGWYAVFEGQSDHLPIRYYAQYGYTDDTLTEMTQHVGVGITASHFLFNQKALVGFGMTAVKLSELVDTRKRWETVAELFVKFDISESVSLKPDLQYIMSPAGEDRDVWVGTMRLPLSF